MDEMGRACNIHVRNERGIEVLVRNLESQRVLGRHRHGWEDKIERYLREMDMRM
jgi:hypothetical protein